MKYYTTFYTHTYQTCPFPSRLQHILLFCNCRQTVNLLWEINILIIIRLVLVMCIHPIILFCHTFDFGRQMVLMWWLSLNGLCKWSTAKSLWTFLLMKPGWTVICCTGCTSCDNGSTSCFVSHSPHFTNKSFTEALLKWQHVRRHHLHNLYIGIKTNPTLYESSIYKSLCYY